jgi:uncharacterized membrane protein
MNQHIRYALKFLHTLGAIGLMGAMASLLVLLAFMPAPVSLAEYAAVRTQMAHVGAWILVPSMGVTLIAGLLSMAFVRAYQTAGWAIAKLVASILVFEWALVIDGGLKQEAELSTRALGSAADAAALGTTLAAERNALWILLAVGAANIILGIWRPRFFPD